MATVAVKTGGREDLSMQDALLKAMSISSGGSCSACSSADMLRSYPLSLNAFCLSIHQKRSPRICRNANMKSGTLWTFMAAKQRYSPKPYARVSF